MKMLKSIMWASIGAGAVLAYQKYEKPMMRKMDKAISKMMTDAGHKLEDMM